MKDRFSIHISSLPIDRHEPVGLAISGGIDSVVLLNLLLENSFRNIVLLHVNYGLRGTESDEDEEFIRKIALQHKLEILVLDAKSLFTKKTAIQETARNIRYEWFSKLLNDKKINCVLTAHQQNDVAETVLFNLFRKTGLKGLSGMDNRDQILRPLLPFSRKEIEQYAQSNKIQWRNDSSNLKSDYSRNFIRNEVLNVIEKQHKEVIKNIAETAFQIRQENELFQNLIDNFSQSLVKSISPHIHSVNLKEIQLFAHPALFLYHLIENKGFNREQTEEIIEAISSEKSGQIWISDTFKACTAGDFLYLLSTPNTFFEGKISWKVGQEFKCSSSNFIVTTIKHFEESESLFLPNELKGKELCLRFWQQGDRITINKKGNTKKLSDLFSEHKIPVILREHIPIICMDNEIVWIPQIRTAFGYNLFSRKKNGFHTYIKTLIL